MNPFSVFKALSAGKQIGVVIGGLIIVGLLIFGISRFIDGAFEASEEKGAISVIVKTQEKELENVGKAKEAVENLNNNDDARLDECLRNSRIPENCR